MRHLLAVSAVAGCWTSPDPVTPTEAAAPAPTDTRAAPRPRPVVPSWQIVRVKNYSRSASALLVGIDAGQLHGVDTTWRAHILDGDSLYPYPGGELEIVRIKPAVTMTRTQLTLEEIQRNTRVRLIPP